jgi:hypothetical protein
MESAKVFISGDGESSGGSRAFLGRRPTTIFGYLGSFLMGGILYFGVGIPNMVELFSFCLYLGLLIEPEWD